MVPVLAIKKEKRQEALILYLNGRVTLEHVPALQKSFVQAWREKAPRVIVDLSNCPYVDSAGIAVLVSALNHARRINRGFFLVAPNRQVLDALELTRLDKVFDIAPTLDAALTP